MKCIYLSEEKPTAKQSHSDIHSVLAQTIREHKLVLRQYFDKAPVRDDVHRHIAEAVAMIKQTASQYRTESIESILQRLPNQKATLYEQLNQNYTSLD